MKLTYDEMELRLSDALQREDCLKAKLSLVNDLMAVAEQVNKLAQESAEELVKERDALAVENASLKSGSAYFMYGPDCGFERHDTQDAAIKAANEMIDDYREDAGDGWCDEVDQVCFGIVLSYASQSDVQKPSEENGFLGSVDYTMSEIETPATDAWVNEQRAKGVDAGIQTIITMLNHQSTGVSASINVLRTFAAQLRGGRV